MSRFGRVIWILTFALVPVAVAGVARVAENQYDFMPSGGRTLLLDIIKKGEAGSLTEIAARQADRKEWRAWAAKMDAGLDDKSLATFAGYAELNFPLQAEKLAALAMTENPQLPADGKDLAIAQCQFCHSLFTGYLMHRRDETGWKATFKSPFHSEIPMTDVERNTFANYSALNMPLRVEDVPPELRF